MSFASILFLAVGLAMDATAAAAAKGLAAPRFLPRHVLLVALLFGGFQAAMPLLGSMLGQRVGPAVQAWDHWIAFILLGAIGAKMIWEALSTDEESEATSEPFAFRPMVILAVATSIDALVVGVTLPMLGAPLPIAILTIGVTTAILSALGLYAGRFFGKILGRRLDFAGGLVLIGLGTKILIEHLVAGSP